MNPRRESRLEKEEDDMVKVEEEFGRWRRMAGNHVTD
jgi:hypothetical protein